MRQQQVTEGARLLREPVMPLVSLVRSRYLGGDQATVAEVIEGLAEPIETGPGVYPRPRDLLGGYLDILVGLEAVRREEFGEILVVDENDMLVEPAVGAVALLEQQVLTRELERINSLLCGPCNCTLCCVGPEASMAQEFFEIPLSAEETAGFQLARHDSEASRASRSGDPDELQLEGRPFYRREDPMLVRWRTGWSMILPRLSHCPNLEDGTGRCLIYDARPEVCRRPQIFPYIVEPLEENPDLTPVYRIRRSLLAIIDCPYVRERESEIRSYGAACGLQVVFRRNKE